MPRGSAHEVTAPYQAFKCSDGYIVLGAANQPNWERTCKAMGREDLMERDEYKTDKDRAVNYLKLAEELEEAFGSDTRASWLQRLEAEGVPCGPILNMAETFDHPQIKARGMAVDVEHPAAGATRVLGFPPQLSGTPGIVRKPSPTLGQHTDEVMKELGKSAGETGRLREEGIVG